MNANSLQVQFDPASARFGAARSQKRLEDDRLLAGKGLFSDDREFPNQAWLVLVRSPHAHAKVSKADLSEIRRQRGVLAAWSMAVTSFRMMPTYLGTGSVWKTIDFTPTITLPSV